LSGHNRCIPSFSPIFPGLQTLSWGGTNRPCRVWQPTAGRCGGTANGLTYNINYTYARGLTDSFSAAAYNGGSGIFGGFDNNPRYDYGNSDLDVRHRIAGSITYAIPYGNKFNGAKGLALKGWQANTLAYWQTGLPFTVTDSATVSAKNWLGQATSTTQDLMPSSNGAGADRPNMVHSGKVSNPSPRGVYIDPTAFQLQTLGTQGNEHRNQIYGWHDRRLDFSVFKTFAIHDRLSMQFRAECFNLFNIANFMTPNSGVPAWTAAGNPASGGSNAFGTTSSTSPAEIPRQFQFALKTTF